jgi:hypothetical protein
MVASPMTAMPARTIRQLACWATNVPRGTPMTLATVRPVIISEIARVARSGGTSRRAATAPTPKNDPWASAVKTRAATRKP